MQLITFDLTEDVPQVTYESQGIPGPRGKDFTFEDFTPEQLEALRGPAGKPGAFTYSDLTPQEKQDLQEEVAKDIKEQLVFPNIPAPFGGYMSRDADAGIVKVKLPQTANPGDRVGFTVHITSTNLEQSGFRVYGEVGSGWTKGEAIKTVGGGSTRIRFGMDSDGALTVFIGETDVLITHPTVTVTNVAVSSNADVKVGEWGTGWELGFINIDPTNVAFDTEAVPPLPLLDPDDIGALPVDGKAADSELLDGLNSSVAALKDTVAVRDGEADLDVRTIKTNIQSQTSIGEGATIAYRLSGDMLTRFATKEAVLRWLGKVKDSERLAGKTLDVIMGEARDGLVQDTVTINNYPLSKSFSLTAADLGLGNVADYSYTNSCTGTSATLYATQQAANAAAYAPLLADERKRKITYGSADPVIPGASEGDIYLQHK